MERDLHILQVTGNFKCLYLAPLVRLRWVLVPKALCAPCSGPSDVSSGVQRVVPDTFGMKNVMQQISILQKPLASHFHGTFCSAMGLIWGMFARCDTFLLTIPTSARGPTCLSSGSSLRSWHGTNHHKRTENP